MSELTRVGAVDATQERVDLVEGRVCSDRTVDRDCALYVLTYLRM